MKTVVMIILFGLSLTFLNAQSFQGVATYKTKRKLDIHFRIIITQKGGLLKKNCVLFLLQTIRLYAKKSYF